MSLVRDIAPEIFRQRHLIEGRFDAALDEAGVRDYMLGLAAALDLETYGEPVVFAPGALIADGMGREINAGYDAFVPLIDSGISGYFWTQAKFFSVVVYSCAGFDPAAAVAYTRDALGATGEVVDAGF